MSVAIGRDCQAVLEAETLCFQNTEASAMSPDQGVGFDDGERVLPVEQTRQSSQCKADGIGRPARFRFSLDKESELFTQEQIFSSDSGGGPETELCKGQCAEKNAEDSPKCAEPA